MISSPVEAGLCFEHFFSRFFKLLVCIFETDLKKSSYWNLTHYQKLLVLDAKMWL
jgi:hypothetical protein